MAGLQRSTETFRRSGSSGLVWEDRFISEDRKQAKKEEEGAELKRSRSVGQAGVLDGGQSNGGMGYRTGPVEPAVDPPSPKVSACGFCRFFGKSAAPAYKPKPKPKPRKR